MKKQPMNRPSWMAVFEQEVTQVRPEFSGRIEWESAAYFYNSGFNPWAAACRYVANRTTQEA